MVAGYIYRQDAASVEYFLVGVFESRAAYVAKRTALSRMRAIGGCAHSCSPILSGTTARC
jgi:hypothetical protein